MFGDIALGKNPFTDGSCCLGDIALFMVFRCLGDIALGEELSDDICETLSGDVVFDSCSERDMSPPHIWNGNPRDASPRD